MQDQLDVIAKYQPLELIGLLVAVVIIISIVWQFGIKVYGGLETWRKKKNVVEDEKEDIEKRVKNLEENDIRLEEKLDAITTGVQQIAAATDVLSTNLNTKLDRIEEGSLERSVISNRTLLYNLHKQFMEKGELTLAEREMVDAVASSYLNAGGNAIFRSKIIPELESLPIKD